MTDKGIEIRTADWERDRSALLTVRFAVFVEEQGVPPQLELDEHDHECRHLLALSTEGRPVGAARLTRLAQIGRMAVLREWRGLGIGSRMLRQLVDIAARKGIEEVFLNAQCTAGDFYRRAGFEPVGTVFEEAGILHRRMQKRIVLRPGDNNGSSVQRMFRN